MTPETRRLATQLYLDAIQRPLRQRVGVEAATVLVLVRALFAEERGNDRLRREERLDAAEALAERIFVARAGPRRSHRRGATPRAKPPACPPGVQRNFQFAVGEHPATDSVDLPPKGRGR